MYGQGRGRCLRLITILKIYGCLPTGREEDGRVYDRDVCHVVFYEPEIHGTAPGTALAVWCPEGIEDVSVKGAPKII